MSDLNQLTISGRLTRNPIVRGNAPNLVLTIPLASNRQYPKGDGTFEEEVVFVDVCVFGRTAERAALRLKKGASCFVAGRLQLNRWQAEDGSNRQQLRIVASQLHSPSLQSRRTQQPQAETIEEAALAAAREAAEEPDEPGVEVFTDEPVAA